MVTMSPDARTTAVPPGAIRTYVTCRRTWRLEAFEPIDPGAGTIDRRRTCNECLNAVDALLTGGEQNIAAISRATGVTEKFVRERRRHLGIPARGYRRLDDIDQLTELTLVEGLSAREIASLMDVEAHTVRRRQLQHGLRVRKSRVPLSDETLARAKQMLMDDEMSYAEAARSLGVDTQTLRRHFPGHGWTRQARSQMAGILKDPQLRALHQQFLGAGRT